MDGGIWMGWTGRACGIGICVYVCVFVGFAKLCGSSGAGVGCEFEYSSFLRLRNGNGCICCSISFVGLGLVDVLSYPRRIFHLLHFQSTQIIDCIHLQGITSQDRKSVV